MTDQSAVATAALLGLHARAPIAVQAPADGPSRFPRDPESRHPVVPAAQVDAALREATASGRASDGAAPPEDPLGGLRAGDAFVVAFPLRSLRGTAAFVTCPRALAGVRAVLGPALPEWTLPEIPADRALVDPGSPCLIDGRHIVLEEFAFERIDGDPRPVADWIASSLASLGRAAHRAVQSFARHFAILSDDDFGHFVRSATLLDARVRVDRASRLLAAAPVEEEMLPPETLLAAPLVAGAAGGAASVEDLAARIPPAVWIGRGTTVGRGLCRTRVVIAAGAPHGT